IFRELAPQVRCAERSACLFAVANGWAAKRMQHSLLGIGAQGLGAELATSDSALALAAPEGFELSFAAKLRSPDAAADAAKQVKDWLWQASLLTRVAGLPAVLDDARLRAEASLLHADLTVSAADLAVYEERAGRLFEESAPSCTQMAAAQ